MAVGSLRSPGARGTRSLFTSSGRSPFVGSLLTARPAYGRAAYSRGLLALRLAGVATPHTPTRMIDTFRQKLDMA